MNMFRPTFLAVALLMSSQITLAQGQKPVIEVSTDREKIQFSLHGDAQQTRVEIFSPSGELVFESDSMGGQTTEWLMRDVKGERVADGIYLATITVIDSLGNRRKRIEQLTIGGEIETDAATTFAVVAPINGQGTTSKVAKFTGVNAIGDSVLTEIGNRIGVNIAPTATLQVNALQPSSLATDGAASSVLLQTSGGKGGNTSGTPGRTAGAGASILLAAGNGGNAPFGSTRGNGGNITLQPGSTGAGGGNIGQNGNVLIGPGGVGNVGIGTSAPASKLTVNGGIQILGAVNGIKFPDGTVQTKAVTVAGTTGQILKFTGPNSFGNSIIKESGANVGIGTASPTAKLEVAGDFKVAGNAVISGNIAAKYQDVAEWVPALRQMAPGTVVSLAQLKANTVEPSLRAYDTRVAGVISAQPGLILGQGGPEKVLVATTGRLKVRVNANRHSISIGDLLVTSRIPGVAMKSQPLRVGGTAIHRPGTIIGKALEPLRRGEREIMVLLSLQ